MKMNDLGYTDLFTLNITTIGTFPEAIIDFSVDPIQESVQDHKSMKYK